MAQDNIEKTSAYKEAHKYARKDNKEQLRKEFFLGITEKGQLPCQFAYDASIPVGVLAPTVQAVKDFGSDLFMSDKDLVEYYKNYDKYKEQTETGIRKNYITANQLDKNARNEAKSAAAQALSQRFTSAADGSAFGLDSLTDGDLFDGYSMD